MDRKTLEGLVAKKEKSDTVPYAVRLPVKLKKKLDAKGIDIAETIRNVLERLAE